MKVVIEYNTKVDTDSSYQPTSDEYSCILDGVEASGALGEDAAANWHDL